MMVTAVSLIVGALLLGTTPPGERGGDPKSLSSPEPVSAVHHHVTAASDSAGIPYFARRFGVSCDRCHVLPAKTNEFGEAFVARGYRIPGVEPRSTWPFAVWASARWEDRPDEEPPVHVNRVEVISGGDITSWLSYFVEWRTVSLESRGDGSLRDRSGRFEDLFLVAQAEGWEAMVGQFRSVQQVDVSRRLTLSEPTVLSTSLSGRPVEGNARRTALRAFSPSGRSPSLRLARRLPLPDEWSWTAAVTLPVPGELSLPLTREARREASNELEWNPKGLFLESYARRGTTSLGAHLFYDRSRRYLAHAVATAPIGPVHWELMAGGARDGGPLRGRWSVEGQLVPHRLVAAGGRLERHAGGGSLTFLPTLNVHFPGTRYTVRLTVERRVQPGPDATVLELGTLF